jgi:U4/U6 small nuclear ribonucleoprotein PRP31
MRKAANRMNFDFNVAEDEYIDGDEIVGLGTINKEGSGRLRLVASQQKVCARAQCCSGGLVAWCVNTR